MTREILNQVDDELDIQQSEGLCINKILAEKIEHAYFDTSGDNVRLQIIMRDNFQFQNLVSIKPPKIDP